MFVSCEMLDHGTKLVDMLFRYPSSSRTLFISLSFVINEFLITDFEKPFRFVRQRKRKSPVVIERY